MGYIASAVNVISSNPCVGPSPEIRVSFPLLSICTDELISAPKIITFFPKFPSVKKNLNENQIQCRSCYTYIYLDQHC